MQLTLVSRTFIFLVNYHKCALANQRLLYNAYYLKFQKSTGV
jgi:hypothetical protein